MVKVIFKAKIFLTLSKVQKTEQCFESFLLPLMLFAAKSEWVRKQGLIPQHQTNFRQVSCPGNGRYRWNNESSKLIVHWPLLWVRSKLIPCCCMHRFRWNGYSAEAFRKVPRPLPPPIGVDVFDDRSSVVVVSSSSAHESHRSFWLPDWVKNSHCYFFAHTLYLFRFVLRWRG